jgi:hypothetical protein
MPRAPAGVVVPDLFMNQDGEWFVNGGRIEHARSAQVLTENVRLADDGIWVTSIGREEAPMRFADTPYFVRSADFADSVLSLRLSDMSNETQRSAEFRRGEDNFLYVRVKHDKPIEIWARFTRAAYQALLPHWQAAGEGLHLPLADGAAWLK